MLLAGDVGGTKTLLGIFERGADRPKPIDTGEFVTLDYDGLESMVLEFLRAQKVSPLQIDSACFGVAGAVTDQVARLTNVPWLVDAGNVAGRVGMRRVWILNDLEALGYGVTVLTSDEMAVLQHGIAVPGGNAAVIAAGTGLGQAMLHNIDGQFVPGASEGGHADFAARTARELEMVAALTAVFGRVSVEHVVSGPGIVNIYQFTHAAIGTGPLLTPSMVAPAKLCPAVGANVDYADLPARITQAALERACPKCVETLAMFVSAYGAEAGNLALRSVATAGVYVGGGIAPKILPSLQDGRFLDAFLAKQPMTDLVATIPIAVIINQDAGLVGAAVYAQTMVERNAL